MVREKKAEESAMGAPLWMVTYGDMMSLLLTFFILILSFSTLHKRDFDSAIGSMRAALGILTNTRETFMMEELIHPDNVFSLLANRLRKTTG